MGSSSGSGSGSGYDYSFKILLIGDSAVGKSSLLVSFISSHLDDLAPTIGVDFKIKHLTIAGKKLKLTIWDTAGQERFRTLTSSYYRSAQGIMLVYDVTRRETFTNLSDVWAKEVELYSTNQDCVKILVGNKVDKESERAVTREEGIALAREYGCLFLECSAKTRANVEKCFEEVALKFVPFHIKMGSPMEQISMLKGEPGKLDNVSLNLMSVLQVGSRLPALITGNRRQDRKRLSCRTCKPTPILEVPSLLEEGSTVGKRNILKQKQEYHSSPSAGCCS